MWGLIYNWAARLDEWLVDRGVERWWINNWLRSLAKASGPGRTTRDRRTGPIFAGGAGVPPLRPDPGNPQAPERPRTAAGPQTSSTSEAVARMRRRAVVDMFDQVGLVVVPPQLWERLSPQEPIDRGVERFLVDLGLNALAIRQRRGREIARANELLELLVQLADGAADLPEHVADAIADALFAGDFAAVRQTASILAAYAEIGRLGARWPADERFAAFSSFLADVDIARRDPLSSSLDDVDQAKSIAAAMAAQMERLDIGRRRLEPAEARLRDDDYLARVDADAITQELAIAHEVVAAVLDDKTFNIDAVTALLDELLRAVGVLEAAAATPRGDRRGKAEGDTRRPADEPIYSEHEQALRYFGFAADAKPSLKDVKRRWIDRIKRAHPDVGGDPAEAKDANRCYDVLKRTCV